ncbi:alkaline phosphatase family protein [Mucilaginibacter gracilis]|nr:alkaline phosphatase family protein [Mucilaginibacter gracilis]
MLNDFQMAAPIFPYIDHVFVLMLENHSFDHLLGFSGILGRDAETGNPTAVDGLTGGESNSYLDVTYPVKKGADYSMPVDPGHEFVDTCLQLTGRADYDPASGYGVIDNSGFVLDYVTSPTAGEGKAPDNFGKIMQCFAPEQLPVLNALAREFAVCDRWFSSVPGPTWPNRFFVHAATSGGLDHSPTTEEILLWQNIGGIHFEQGNIFDQLRIKFDDGYRLYRGTNFLSDVFPNVAALKGINATEVHKMWAFDADVNSGNYPYPYTFIEPSYGDVLHNTYKGGSSQHPLDDATGGEKLIKSVYESIRRSPLWPKSLLLVLWDEHGGFYDHVAPPAAVAPGDRTVNASLNQYGFDFKQYGVRVPAVIISPLIRKNTVDHRVYDHASVSATLHDLFDTDLMTERDANANSLMGLLDTANPPRTDAPMTLPDPADSVLNFPTQTVFPMSSGTPGVTANKGSLPGILHAALKTDLAISPPEDHPAIQTEFAAIQTQDDAAKYMGKVKGKMDAGNLSIT